MNIRVLGRVRFGGQNKHDLNTTKEAKDPRTIRAAMLPSGKDKDKVILPLKQRQVAHRGGVVINMARNGVAGLVWTTDGAVRPCDCHCDNITNFVGSPPQLGGES